MLDEELTSLGFSDKERRFYLAAFESGAATVNDLASRAGVSRTNGYDLLGRLQSRGLLKTVPSSAGRLVVPEDPSVLSQDWERRRTTLNATIPKLRAMLESSGMRWSVRSYRGVADIERALKMWNERSRGEGIAFIGAMASTDEGISAITLHSIARLQREQPGTQLMVSSQVSGSVRELLEGLPAQYTDATAEGFVPAVAVLTEGDFVYIVSTGAEAYLLSIRSGSFAALARLLLTQLGTSGRTAAA